jgi:hypothetical protein
MSATAAEGRWEPIVMQVWDTVVTPCDCCGQVVARRQWVVAVDGAERRFCGPDCEQLYRSYVVPARAAETATG